jgi:membrane-associated phospholipid phosphatase
MDFSPHQLAALVLISLPLAGCGTLPNGQLWGEDATLRPGWERVRASAVDAARDPWVWAPLAGAAAFQIDDLDRRTADWARERTPVFGSQRSAETWSDRLRDAAAVSHYATIAATPGGDEPAEWIAAKTKGVLASMAAVSSTTFATRQLKKGVDRERPNGLAGESFPSGHTSSASVHTRLASENLRSIGISAGARRTADVGLTTLNVGTSWARIEAGWHYPSDTLFSMALGNFIASFVYSTFLHPRASNASLRLTSTSGELSMQWQWTF